MAKAEKYKFLRKLMLALALLSSFILIYIFCIRPFHLNWGTTPYESSKSFPGDALIQNPEFVATRAITIQAAPEEIWPWIVQIGYKRAGFYSYDWFDNLAKPSSSIIMNEFQNVKLGDYVPITPFNGLVVHDFKSYKYLVWRTQNNPIDGIWIWYLNPLDENETRLITKLIYKYDWKSPVILFNLMVDFGDFPFMRKCIEGIKMRAENNLRNTFIVDVFRGILWVIPMVIFLISLVRIFTRNKNWVKELIFLTISYLIFWIAFYSLAGIYIISFLELLLIYLYKKGFEEVVRITKKITCKYICANNNLLKHKNNERA